MKTFPRALVALALACALCTAQATPLSGTLAKVRDTGAITVSTLLASNPLRQASTTSRMSFDGSTALVPGVSAAGVPPRAQATPSAIERTYAIALMRGRFMSPCIARQGRARVLARGGDLG